MRANQGKTIIGKHVVLVPYAKEHVPKYHAWMCDAEIRALTASEPLSLAEELEMQQKWAEDEDKLTFIVLARELLEPGTSHLDPGPMVGDVNLFFCNSDQDGEPVAEVEVMIAEADWRGKGLGAEAAALIMRYAAEVLGRRRFQAKIGLDNAASRHLFADKFGFKVVAESSAFREVTLSLDWAKDGPRILAAASDYELKDL